MAWEPYVSEPIDVESMGDMTIAEVFPDPGTWLPAYLQFGKPLCEMPATGQNVCLVLFGIGTLATIIYALMVLKRTRARGGGLASWWPLFVLIGAFISVSYECFDCSTLHCLYPQDGGIYIIEMWGMKLPLYLGFIYPFYVSALIIFVFDWIERGKVSSRVFWIIFLFAFSGAFAFEPIALKAGMWYYWGVNQPFKILGFPFYWFFINPAMIAAVGPCLHFIWNDLLKRKHAWALMFLLPFVLTGIHIAIASPIQFAINSTLNMVIVNGAAVLSCVVAIGTVYVAAKLAARQNEGMIEQMTAAGLDPELEANPKKAAKDEEAPAAAATA